jgi:anti-sigma B factor antagonist
LGSPLPGAYPVQGATMGRFRIKAAPGDKTCTLILHGEADLAVADDIVALGTLSLAETTTDTLILDLEAVTFMDSTSIGAMIRLRNLATDSGKHLQLAHVPDRVRQVLSLTGLGGTFEEASLPC